VAVSKNYSNKVKNRHRSKSISLKLWIAPLQRKLLKRETGKWRDSKEGINRKPQVVILNKDVLTAPSKKGDRKGESVLGPKANGDYRKVLTWVAKYWAPNIKAPKTSPLRVDIKKFNIDNLKKGGEFVVTYNFRHSRTLFEKLKSEGLLQGEGFTHRGHEKAAVRYHAESEIDKLAEFEQSNAITGNREAKKAARALRKTLQARADYLTPDLDHQFKVDIDAQLNHIKGLEELIFLVPEAAADNLSKKEEQELKDLMDADIRAWLKKHGKRVIELSHSKSIVQSYSDVITDTLLGNKKVKPYRRKGSKKVKTKSRKVPAIPIKNATPPKLRTSGGRFTSAMNIQAILNAKIKEEVADNMGKGGALVYRTGRFAESVSVQKVMQSRQGALTAFYTYMKAPYQTFERGYAQGSLRRDPRKLIAASIREIARETLSHKIHIKTRRV
jgi:hypothetical protein